MALALTYTLTNGPVADANQVQQNFNDVANAFPVQDTNQGAIAASKVAVSAGFQWPASSIPQSVYAGAASDQSMNYLSSDPAFIRAYGLSFTRRTPVSTWVAPTGGGFVAPIKDGVVMCSRTANCVYEFPRNSAGGTDNLYVTQATHTFTSGDKPIDAVCKDQSVAYVLCQGNSPTSNPQIKTINLGVGGGAASSWLDFGSTYTSVRRICINRQGSYLYVAAKKSGDTNHRRILRVDTATKVVSECDTGNDYDIHNLCVVVNSGSAATSLGEVFALQGRQAATYGETIWRTRESTTGVYGGSLPSTVDGYVYRTVGVAATQCAMVPFGTGVVVAYSDNAGNLFMYGYSYHSTPYTTSAVLFSQATIASGELPILGGAWTDGRLVRVPTQGGYLYSFDPYTATVPTASQPFLATGSNYTDACGGAFTGRNNMGYLYNTGTGAGYLFAF